MHERMHELVPTFKVRHGRRRTIGATVFAALVFGAMQPGCRNVASQESSESHTESATVDAKSDEHGHDHVEKIRLTPEAVERNSIAIGEALLQELNPTFVAPARVTFNSEAVAHVGSTLPGRIVELRARLGEKVQAGAPLLVVESPQLGEAQSDFLEKIVIAEAATATVDLAKNRHNRATALYEQNRGIALDEVQKRDAEFRMAEASVRTTQAAAVAAENMLHTLGMTQEAVDDLRASQEVRPRFTIVAPIAGEVVEREVTLGELVGPQREKLLVLADVETLWVIADVAETHLPKIAIGAKAWINAGSLDDHKHEGQVSYIAPMIDPRTRTVSVRVEVACEDRSLKPGMFVQVELSSARAQSNLVVTVDEAAVQTMHGQPVVFIPVPGEANTFAPRGVTVGEPVNGRVPVYGGLHEGEAYVVAGSFLLKADAGKGTAEHNH